jgi:hypothetical protein
VLIYFLREEYYKSNSEIAYSWSIKVRNLSVEEKAGDDVELMEAQEIRDVVELTKFRKSSRTSGRAMLK